MLLGLTHSQFPKCTRQLRFLYVFSTEFSTKVLMYQAAPAVLILHRLTFNFPESTGQTLVDTFPAECTQRRKLPFACDLRPQFIDQTFLSPQHEENQRFMRQQLSKARAVETLQRGRYGQFSQSGTSVIKSPFNLSQWPASTSIPTPCSRPPSPSQKLVEFPRPRPPETRAWRVRCVTHDVVTTFVETTRPMTSFSFRTRASHTAHVVATSEVVCDHSANAVFLHSQLLQTPGSKSRSQLSSST